MENAAPLNLTEVRAAGVSRGEDIASWQDLPEIGSKTARGVDWIGIAKIESVDDAQEYFMCLCSSAEENNRSYSPFGFTAKDLNDAENSEEAWEAYNEGIGEGFLASWESRKSYYDNSAQEEGK